jgi:transcriptional regulator with XRE-family HTH domain
MIGEALRLIRVYHDLKQSDLADQLGISQSHLSEIERGKKAPTSELIERYSKEFRLPVSSIWFFDEHLAEGVEQKTLDRARGVIADKVLNFLRIIERRRMDNDTKA